VDRRIRQVAGLITALLLVIAGTSGWIQGVASESIANRIGSPEEPAVNRFRIFQECRWQRGDVLSIDGQVLAESVPAPAGRRCLFQRTYPSGDLIPHVVGQWSLHFGRTGLEATYNSDLVGDPVPPRNLTEFFSERPRRGNTLVSTIDTRLQRVALEAMEGRRGGVVALNPKTGAVYVAASIPSYDPTPLASNDRVVADEARCRLGIGETVTTPAGELITCDNPASPMVSTALQNRRPPGSTFKVVTAAAALESGEYTATSPSIPSSAGYVAPGNTRPIRNYGGGSCGGTLHRAIQISCNTAMSRVAVEIGSEKFLTTAHAMGLDQFSGAHISGCSDGPISDIQQTYTGCLPESVKRSDGSEEKMSTPGFRALAGFGQGTVLVSPFGMAIVTGTVANQGFVPSPRFADRVTDQRGATIREVRRALGAAAISTESAAALAAMMRSVVTAGTATRAFGGFRVPVAGKTGTADEPSCPADQVAIFGPNCGRLAHAWFIAFAPIGDPSIAIAVLVERGGGRDNATGGRVAAPVARRVLEEYFALNPGATGN
jgi:peptidoglycan glycosyltransferase